MTQKSKGTEAMYLNNVLTNTDSSKLQLQLLQTITPSLPFTERSMQSQVKQLLRKWLRIQPSRPALVGEPISAQ